MGKKLKKSGATSTNSVKIIKSPKRTCEEKIVENFIENEEQKEKKLLNLIAEIIVEATLKELYETGN